MEEDEELEEDEEWRYLLNTLVKEEMEEMDEEYRYHLGDENVVLNIFERKFLATTEPEEDTREVVFVFLTEIGFSEEGAKEIKDDFMDPSVVHYTMWNWVLAFLKLKLYPVVQLQEFPYYSSHIDKWAEVTDPPISQGQFWNGIPIEIINLTSVNSNQFFITLEKELNANKAEGNFGLDFTLHWIKVGFPRGCSILDFYYLHST